VPGLGVGFNGGRRDAGDGPYGLDLAFLDINESLLDSVLACKDANIADDEGCHCFGSRYDDRSGVIFNFSPSWIWI